jgi:hypothetical protein
MDQLGRFKLRRELGEGPYTVAYEALDGAQRCVVKVIKDETVPSESGRRAGLVAALAGLKAIEHPSAVRVLDAGEGGGKLFVCQEFMGCPTLEQKLADKGKLAEQQVVLFVRQAGQALDKARDLGYGHGDLTARNVFVVSEEKVKLSDFSLKALCERPPDLSEIEGVEGRGFAADDEAWVTAEDLLRTRSKKAVTDCLDEDLVGMAALMARMLGLEVPDRAVGEPLARYRESLMRGAYQQAASAGSGVGMHTAEVMRRLLTAGEFDSPGEVVVELASAMLLGRTFGRSRAAAKAEPAPAASETAEVRAAAQAAQAEPDMAVRGAAAEVGTDLEGSTFTTFFVWTDRRSGRFFILRDGEQLAIGRDPEVCEIVLMDPAVSRRHCYLSKDGPVIRVEDCGSSNGSFVNDQRVQTADLRAGDRLRVGGTRVYTALPRGEA